MLQNFHSYLSYLVLLGLLISIIAAMAGLAGTKPFNRKMGLLGLIPAHLQGVLGIILYFVSPLGIANASGAAMKDSISRLYMLEHPLTMIIALVLITIGYSRSKRLADDRKRYRSIVIFYGIALLLILIRIPWHAWPGN